MTSSHGHDQCAGLLIVIAMIVLMAPMCGATQNIDHLFGRDVITPSWLAAIDADIKITAESVEWRGAEFHNVHIPVKVKLGVIAIDAARADLADGSVSATVKHDPRGITALALRGEAMALGRMPALSEYLSDLPVDVTIDLRGAGVTPHTLAASATGTIYVRNTARGTIKKLLELSDERSITDFLLKLNPFRDEARVTSVECLAIDIPVDNGIVDDEHFFEMMTDVVNVKAAAQIDFARESIYAAFMPEARRGVTLSSLATGDVVLIEGDLSAPEIEVMKGHLLEKGVSLGGAIAKLGTSKLFSMIGNAQVNASLCADGTPPNGP